MELPKGLPRRTKRQILARTELHDPAPGAQDASWSQKEAHEGRSDWMDGQSPIQDPGSPQKRRKMVPEVGRFLPGRSRRIPQ